MNEACIALAEEMTSRWLNPILQASGRPCPSLTCGVYREAETLPEPPGCQRRWGRACIAGRRYWSVWLSLPPSPILSSPHPQITATLCSLRLRYQLSSTVPPLTRLWPCCQALSRSLCTSPAGISTSKALTVSEASSSLTVVPQGVRRQGITEVGAGGQVNFLHWFWSCLNAAVIRHIGLSQQEKHTLKDTLTSIHHCKLYHTFQ